MNRWAITRDQWIGWIEQGVAPMHPVQNPLDPIDAHLAGRLSQHPFHAGDEETISRPEVPSGSERFDSMTTMVRTTVDSPSDEDATRIRRPEPLEVGLRAPEDGLEVSLQPPPDQRTTLVAEAVDPSAVAPPVAAPVPEAPPVDPALETRPTIVATTAPVSGETVIAQAPAAPPEEEDDDGLFIPTLTKTVVESAPPLPEPPEPQPDPFYSAPAVPSPVEPAAAAPMPQPSDLPPAISGDTVVGPPPAPPDESALASGYITTGTEQPEAAETLVRGEIPSGEDAEVAVPRPQKVVIDPSASGVLSTVYDEEEPDDEPLEVEPQELDADDLFEEGEVEDQAGPPPAPSRPPPAPEAALSVGPPPPPVSSSTLDAAMAALPVAPSMDEGWQVDMFAEHYAALLPVHRQSIAAAEADFIIHCAGLTAGSSVLDIGCGDGAHCVAMAARGLAVTGLDPSPVQLMRASQNAQALGLSVNLVAGDMRQPPVEGQFDTILCLGGTLGMHGDEDDRISLQKMVERLVPGGRLMLHVLNRDYIANRLPARSWWQGQGCLILDEAQMFSPTGRLHVHRTIVFETGTQFEHNVGLRVYGLTELVHMCAQVGLRVLEFSGSRHTRGRFYGGTSSEIWLLAQRPPA